MSITSNTGRLIGLAKINRLDILQKLFSQVEIPPAVQRELLSGGRPETDLIVKALGDFIQVIALALFSPAVKLATYRLGLGEQEAIALAHQRGALLLIDDRAGRIAARKLGIPVTGLAGILIEAKKAGIVSQVVSSLNEIRKRGYWLSDELIREAARLAGEES